jgi:hypothetical protein
MHIPDERQPAEPSVPRRLLDRLDRLGAVLARRGDAIALIGLGSVGAELDRLDDHSDLDFFVIVEDAAKRRYIDSIDWLEELCPVSFSFANSVDGRKALFADGLFAEYAVFTLEELARSPFSPGRVVWRRADAPDGLETPPRPLGPGPLHTVEHQVGEALTNLYVGLKRDARGERLSAMRLIQSFAVDRVLTLLAVLEPAALPTADVFAVERRAEARFGPETLPLAEMTPGYRQNREAARAILAWLEARVDVDPALAEAIRTLAA